MEKNEINNSQIKQKLADATVQVLLNNKLIIENELPNFQIQFGYIFTKEDEVLEALMKTICNEKIFYFACQKGSLMLININENQYNETINYMKNYHACLNDDSINETEKQKNRRQKNNQFLIQNGISINENLSCYENNIKIKNAEEYFQKKDYTNALYCFKQAKKIAERQDEKRLVSLRIGECYFETNDLKKALNELTYVYVLGGKSAFENEDKKYFEYFKENVLKGEKRKQLFDYISSYTFNPNLDTFKRIFEICEIDATYRKLNAFAYAKTKDNLKFLIDSGLNPNSDCGEGYPAIVYHINSHSSCILYLKEQGADLDLAMEYAKKKNNIAGMCNLMECGAKKGSNLSYAMKYAQRHYYFVLIERLLDMGAKPGYINITKVLEKSNNGDIIVVSKLSRIKFSKGLKIITPRMKKAVKSIGERFEFYRNSFNKELIDEAAQALEDLYKIYKVKPVLRRNTDSIKKIIVKSKTWQEQHEELWQMLVPGSGAASSVQGELIRIVGRATDEIYRNGGINWENEYQKMIDAIPEYVKKGKFDKNDEIIELSKKINANSDMDELYLLCQLIVEWVLANPDVIELKNVDYKR